MDEAILTYQGNPHVKRDGVIQEFTNHEFEEYVRCKNDPVYFCKNYLKVIHLDRGLVPFDLYPYQEEMFDHFKNNQFSIVLACRQSGKSISSIGYLLWYAIFHPGKTIAILANKGATAREMLGRLTLMLENLPFFLQPGCKALNKGSIEFSNNSRVFAASTSSDSIRGFSVNLLFLDEFAFINDAASFYTSTYPVITSGKSARVIITSTANGIGNQYHKLWVGANQGVNSYKPFRVDWWDVPGRDKEWKEQTIANTSQIQFDQEFGNTFYGTGDTLIDGETLLGLQRRDPKSTIGSVNIYEHPEEGHNYILVSDVARGLNSDYTTFNIIDISVAPFKQVATYRDNKISPMLFPDIVYKWATAYNEAYVIIESNDHGIITLNGLYHDLEYENTHVESIVKADKLGVYMDKKVKRLGCSGFKDILESNKLEIVDEETINEISTFEAKGTSFEASSGNHDDLVMTLVMFGYFAGTNNFEDMTEMNLRNMLFNKKQKLIENEELPFFAHDDGLGFETQLEQELPSHSWSLVKDNDYENGPGLYW